MAEVKEEKLVKAIEVLSDKITGDVKADEALKFTQAALNVANTMITLEDIRRVKKAE